MFLLSYSIAYRQRRCALSFLSMQWSAVLLREPDAVAALLMQD